MTGHSLSRRLRGAAPLLKRLAPGARPEAASPEAGPCAVCRGRDTWSEQLRIIEELINAAAESGVTLYRLPSRLTPRFGIGNSQSSESLQRLASAVKSAGIKTVQKTAQVQNNKYEFDQVTAVPPDTAEHYLLFPQHHCEAGKKYLRSRAVSLELLRVDEHLAIVPRAGLGPRVYAKEQLSDLAAPGDLIGPEDALPEPVDLVYTWVDSGDPEWQAKFEQFSGTLPDVPRSAANAARWQARDELRYSLRSAWMYAPFLRNIFIVTNGQVPSWLRTTDKVRVVTHEELFEDTSVLPTFSSRPIETVLHRIDGLSEHFLYLNDDFFFGAPLDVTAFFSFGGVGKIFFSNRYLDDRPVGEHDRASVVAHKNAREVLKTRFGATFSRKFKHAPYVMRRSVWEMLEKDFADEIALTRKNRFRSWNDVGPVPFLYNHYAHALGYAVPGEVTYRYVDLQDPDLPTKIADLEERVQVFCINDADSDGQLPDGRESLLVSFLANRFPVVPPWEEI